MALTRKRKRELKKLRANTEILMDQQRDVLHNAGVVLSQATHQARELGAEEVMPRINEKLETVRPYIDKNVTAAKRAADRVKIAIAPVVATALAKTVTALDNIDARDAAAQVEKFGRSRGILEKPKKKSGLRFFALGVGVAAAVAVGATIWQAFREDDEDMWVSAED